jgi:hypothetical protein
VTRERKIALTALTFVIVIGLVVVTAATKAVAPLFVAWVPLIGLGWVHTRPDPGEAFPSATAAAPPEEAAPDEADGEEPAG